VSAVYDELLMIIIIIIMIFFVFLGPRPQLTEDGQLEAFVQG